MTRPDSNEAAGLPQARPMARALALGVAFIGGWSIMMLELMGARLLAPTFGYSIYQWGGLLGVVLGAMAIGYFVGGRLGDRAGAARFLALAIAFSAAWAFATPDLLAGSVPAARGWGPAWGAVMASIVILGPPSFLLATISPIVARLSAHGGIAETAGTVYGVSTLGSISGTFATAFWVIPEIGTRDGFFLAGAILLAGALGAAALGRSRGALAGILIAPLALLPGGGPDQSQVVYRAESIHNTIIVEDYPRFRALFLNYREGAQTLLPHEGVLTGAYYDRFILGPQLAQGSRTLFLGSAGGTALRQITAAWPDAQVTGVDLDPAVIDVSRRFFGLDAEPRIDLVAADARLFVGDTQERFDVIAVDLYVTGHIPYYCTTAEFFADVKRRLKPGGVMMMNVLAIQPDETLTGSMANTALSVFPSAFWVGQGNFILIATAEERALEDVQARLAASEDPLVQQVAADAMASLRAARRDPALPVFTDERNDVEQRSFHAFYGG